MGSRHSNLSDTIC